MKYRSGSFSKIILLIILAFIMVISIQINVKAEQVNDPSIIIKDQLNSNELKKIQADIKKQSSKDFNEIIPGFDPKKIMEDAATGKLEFSFSSIMNRIGNYFFKEINSNINVLVKLIVIALFCAILKNLQTSFLSESVGEMAFYASYIFTVTILVITLNTALGLGRSVIDTMVTFMHSTIPVLVTLMISGGNVATGSILQPVLIMIVEIAAAIFKNIFLPLVFLTSVLNIVDNISEKVQISKLASFIKQINVWSLGIILTVFIGIVSIQGSLGAVIDGVTSKTAKFAIGAFIPVAGKYLADAADTVLGCTLIIKNAAGIAVLIGILAICLIPLLKILALIALYKITSVLIEPISEKRITNCINDIANSMTYILGIAATVAFMFLITITAVISASNISAMIR